MAEAAAVAAAADVQVESGAVVQPEVVGHLYLGVVVVPVAAEGEAAPAEYTGDEAEHQVGGTALAAVVVAAAAVVGHNLDYMAVLVPGIVEYKENIELMRKWNYKRNRQCGLIQLPNLLLK